MAIEIILNRQTMAVNKEQLFALAANGTIGPETNVNVNGQLVQARKIKGIAFGHPFVATNSIQSLPYSSPNPFVSTTQNQQLVPRQIHSKIYDFRRIASAQRLFIVAIGLMILALILVLVSMLPVLLRTPGEEVVPFPPIVDILILLFRIGTTIFSIVAFIGLARSLQYSVLSLILLPLCFIIPIISLIVMVVVNNQAISILTAAGYQVDLFGANKRQFE